MTPELFVGALGLTLGALLIWGFYTLPNERWQIIAAVPVMKDPDGNWRGLNLTYYGFFTATACALGAVMFTFLSGAMQTSGIMTLLIGVAIFSICLPASGGVARWVERKPHTLTIAGAMFVGILITPGAVALANLVSTSIGHPSIHLVPISAALAISYALGEGVGRLACISFGCCYGKSLSEVHPVVRGIFSRWHFTFFGNTKKIAYAAGLDGTRVVPIQGLTALVYIGSALLGTLLFLKGLYAVAFLTAIGATNLARVWLELLRADYRGHGRFSAYQVMALVSVVYCLSIALLASANIPHSRPSLFAGFRAIWTPEVFLFIVALWIVVFLYTGRSSVTESRVSFYVLRHKT
jgi:hypothetical protein